MGKSMSLSAHQPSSTASATYQGPLPLLLADLEQNKEAFRSSALMRLLGNSRLAEPAVKARLMAGLQVWANHFQTLLHLRMALGRDPAHIAVAADHQQEELGHHHNLRRQRGPGAIDIWDPVMEGAAHWFVARFHAATDLERTMIMHLVIESSAEIFFLKSAYVFPDMPHFSGHAEDDGGHIAMGLGLLSAATAQEVAPLRELHDQGWRMITLLCDRMAEVALHSDA
jgi:hypothetical protein